MEAPTLTFELADEIAKLAKEQIELSRRYRQPRLAQIHESEDYYFGIVKPQLRNVFNISFPFMSGFVDHLRAKIDDPPKIKFAHLDIADYSIAKKITAAWEMESSSPKPHAKWALKDRWAKLLAIFSGRGIYKIYAESDPEYRTVFDVVDYNDFGFEPNGGGHLENHLFLGEDSCIFRTKSELLELAKSGWYELEQVRKLLYGSDEDRAYKQTLDALQQRQDRQRKLGMDPQTHNYVGEKVFRLSEWYTTFKGVRWQVILDAETGIWLRIKPLKEVFKDGLYPYVSWATHEDPKIFLSKSPADDARPIAEAVNVLLNQELYNRNKRNMGQRAYDPTMFKDVEALSDWRPDGLVPADTKGGLRRISDGVYTFEVGELRGTIDLVQFLDSFHGRMQGVTPGSEGLAEHNKRASIYFGELQQVADRLGVYNKSYREAYEELGIRYQNGIIEHLNKPMAIQLFGAEGEKWDTLAPKDLAFRKGLRISIEGGAREQQESEIQNQRKLEALKVVTSVNPRWRDEQILRAAGYSEHEIKRAFEATGHENMELMSAAERAVQNIIKGKTPKLNYAATADFLQYLVDRAAELDEPEEVKLKVIRYAQAHKDIVVRNEAKMAAQSLRARTEPALPGAPAPSALKPTPSLPSSLQPTGAPEPTSQAVNPILKALQSSQSITT